MLNVEAMGGGCSALQPSGKVARCCISVRLNLNIIEGGFQYFWERTSYIGQRGIFLHCVPFLTALLQCCDGFCAFSPPPRAL